MTETDIAYENGQYWVWHKRGFGYVVMRPHGLIASEIDSTYSLGADGFSLAKARCDYLASRK